MFWFVIKLFFVWQTFNCRQKKHWQKQKKYLKLEKSNQWIQWKRKYKSETMNEHLTFLGLCHSVLIWLQVMQRTANNARRTVFVRSNCQVLKEFQLYQVDQCRKINKIHFLSFVTGWMIRQRCSPSLRYMKNFALSLVCQTLTVSDTYKNNTESTNSLLTSQERQTLYVFKDMANEIMNTKWYADRSPNLTGEGTIIIIAAARLIRSDIRSKTFDIEYYPAIKDFESGIPILPPSSELLMKSSIG